MGSAVAALLDGALAVPDTLLRKVRGDVGVM